MDLACPGLPSLRDGRFFGGKDPGVARGATARLMAANPPGWVHGSRMTRGDGVVGRGTPADLSEIVWDLFRNH
ncbi:MAG: hypothetical protein RLZZ399_557 [Verrucomicrobiota bacterium]|jgi:hypothetical protein